MKKRFFFYRDFIGPIDNKFSPAEIVGTLAVIALVCSAVAAVL